MQALMKMSHDVGDVKLCDIPEPAVTDDTVKIKIKYCGICGTDIHIYHDSFTYYPPVIMGHEGSGEIVAVGKNIKNRKVGDRVAVLGSTMVQCGTCEYCKSGMYMFCANRRGMGHGVNGMFTEYIVVREDQCYLLPDDMGYEMGALMEAFGTAVNAVEELTPIHSGDVVLLTGPGPIGLLCAALLVKKGCYVIAAGMTSDTLRLERAKALGVQRVVDLQKEDVLQVVADITNGRGADVVVESSGNERAMATCFEAVKKTGTYIQTGINGKEQVSVPFDKILYKQLRVCGALGHSLETWSRMERLYKYHLVDLLPLVSDKMPLSQWEEAFRRCEHQEAVKVLLYSDDEVKENG